MAKTSKVILTHEVGKLGVAGDVVEVKPGFARNYLLPRKLATPWTPGAQKQIDRMKAAQAKRQIESMEIAQQVKEKLAEGPVLITAKAGESGRLFGAVSSADIAAAVKEQKEATIDRRKVVIEQPIKSVGSYKVSVRLFENVTASLEVTVRAAK